MSGFGALSSLSVRCLHNGNEPGITGVMPLRDDETRRIRDPVHGLIVFGGSGDGERDETDRIAWRLLDTREFQRLRRIRQLGFSDLVFPGATHSRFAHSVGVYHTARRLADVISRHEGKPDPERERVALLAALLHDIGHGPFSHAFESVGAAAERVSHEDWSVRIVGGDTEVNEVLQEMDNSLPDRICALLTEEEPKDIYTSIVSSQFDADRLDYVQRDRKAAGVEFGHVDRDWLFDCLEVGRVTIGDDRPYEAQCLYLGPKGVDVAVEYLEARFRLYRMVYTHKTTRAAEKMLEVVLNTAAKDLEDDELADRDPVLRYLTSKSLNLEKYLDLDDSAVWATLASLEKHSHPRISKFAKRLRDRELYKCIDVGSHDEPGRNLYRRALRRWNSLPIDRRDDFLFDDFSVTSYRWYEFSDASALNKVLVKTDIDMPEPTDIADVSPLVRELGGTYRYWRVYAPDMDAATRFWNLLGEDRA